MEYGADASLVEVRHERLPRARCREHEVIQMPARLAAGGHHGLCRAGPSTPVAELALIGLPDMSAPRLNLRLALELTEQEGRDELGGDVARPDVHPGVLVHLAAKEPIPVRALLTNDLGALDQSGVVDHERAPFAAGEVLRVVEAQRGHRAEGAELLVPVLAQEAMRIVLDDRDAALGRQAHDDRHVAGDTGIMHGHYRSCSR